MTTQNEKAEKIATAEEAYTGRFEWIDPLDFNPEEKTSQIVIDPFNHRKQRKDVTDTTVPNPAMVDSVRAVGVQTPIMLRPQVGENEGKLGVVMGQRRIKAARLVAMAAVEDGRDYQKVPAIVRDDLKGVNDEALLLSMVENVHRAAASGQDDIDAAQQLALMVRAKRIPKARRTRMAEAIGRTMDELDAAPRVAEIAPEVMKELTEEDVQFDWVQQADYNDVRDVPDALWELEEAQRKDEDEGNTKRGAWRQAMHELKAAKATAERIASAEKELAEKKISVVKWRAVWQYTPSRPLDGLLSSIGFPLTEHGHRETCKGHAAAIDPADGEVLWLCADFKKYEHRMAGAPQPGADETDEAADEEAAKKEAEREEGRRVRLNNAAWRSVREVRQDFITEMCQGKGEAPADVKALVMTAILEGRYSYTHYVGWKSGEALAKFLNDEKLNTSRAGAVATLVKRTAAKRMWWLLFAHIAGMYEFEFMDDDAWRGVKAEYGGRKAIRTETVAWLDFLKAHGYSLSEVETETVTTAQRQIEEAAKKDAERKERAERQQREREEAKAKREAEALAGDAEAVEEPDDAEAVEEPDDAEAVEEPDDAEAVEEPDDAEA
ncbi:ParB N-terminal domain-containing protein, partial [Streptomyces niveus]|uniref:ParB/RepB/Spo0J family partition protein n=1 Tax=Streptomyces niveus TaxID=193462 RepID=UPI0036CF89E6